MTDPRRDQLRAWASAIRAAEYTPKTAAEFLLSRGWTKVAIARKANVDRIVVRNALRGADVNYSTGSRIVMLAKEDPPFDGVTARAPRGVK